MIVGSDPKWREHVDKLVRKANATLGMLKITFESREPMLWKDQYVSLGKATLAVCGASMEYAFARRHSQN